VNADCLKLTIHFGERDRIEGRFLADALLDCCERHGLAASVLDLDGSRRIEPARVGCLVDSVGSRRVLSDRLEDQGPSDEESDGKAS
jgi:hypothetical protein